MDVQIAPVQAAIIVERNARTTKQPRRSKQRKKAELDEERGRFRHTIRLDPKVEQKLRMVAEILGIDLNAAIAVCISVHHHRLTKAGGETPDEKGLHHFWRLMRAGDGWSRPSPSPRPGAQGCPRTSYPQLAI